jgi:hypothetical protein
MDSVKTRRVTQKTRKTFEVENGDYCGGRVIVPSGTVLFASTIPPHCKTNLSSDGHRGIGPNRGRVDGPNYGCDPRVRDRRPSILRSTALRRDAVPPIERPHTAAASSIRRATSNDVRQDTNSR